ncbi:MAG: orotidine-5-phosphate decarboxylase [Actinomycetota bacterium]|nr:orotidine-5-phosphate decarboxylase [Actinomycetota bacterium]
MTTVIKRPDAHTFVPSNPICVALDSADRATIKDLVDATAGHVGMFKIGLTTFVSTSSDVVREVGAHAPVFLDLKLHDIPMQVSGAVKAAAETGASMVTIHASGGRDMVRAAAEAAPSGLAVLAVTVLTSLDDDALGTIGLAGPAGDAVLRLADLALQAGADGLVCSPLEIERVRARFGAVTDGGPLLVVPGIRPDGGSTQDQRRTMSAAAAVEAGADVIVVGRPITGAPDPGAAARAISKELG